MSSDNDVDNVVNNNDSKSDNDTPGDGATEETAVNKKMEQAQAETSLSDEEKESNEDAVIDPSSSLSSSPQNETSVSNNEINDPPASPKNEPESVSMEIDKEDKDDAPVTPKHSPSTSTAKADNNNNYSNENGTITPGLTPPNPNSNRAHGKQPLPMLSECLYGVPEDDEVWDGFFAQQTEDVVDPITGECNDLEIWKRQARVRGHSINMGILRRLAAQGVPDEGSHRGVVWRLLLGPFLTPDNIDHWQDTLREKRGRYYTYCNNFFLWNDWNFGHSLRVKRKLEHRGPVVLRLDVDESYHSMSVSAEKEESEHDEQEDDDSKAESKIPTRPTPSKMFNNPNVLKNEIPQTLQDAWVDKGKDLHILEALQKSFNALKLPPSDDQEAIHDFVESVSLLDEIRKDVVRTHSDLSFFLDPIGDLGKRRYAAIERILFLWAKYNKTGVRYVQGMNEIVGALYYVCANDSRTEWANAAEADTFWLLEALLDDMRDVFVPELDAVDTGIRGRISALQDLLERHDPALKEHFVELSIDASFYAVRWLTTLLSREFLLPDTIRLWDAMFASTHKDNFLRYVCVTMLLLIRDQLLSGDFGTCIRLLQRYPTVHMDQLLESSRSLYIYETQITVACHRANISKHTALLTIKPPPSLIMAFGFKRGIPPAVPKSSSQRVSAFASSTGNAFKGLYHRMRSWSSSTPEKSQSEELKEEPKTPERAQGQTPLAEETPVEEDIYMQAILGHQESP